MVVDRNLQSGTVSHKNLAPMKSIKKKESNQLVIDVLSRENELLLVW